ncbi:MAG: hypothetical protein ACI4JC_10445 [Faecalibacterium sp.]
MRVSFNQFVKEAAGQYAKVYAGLGAIDLEFSTDHLISSRQGKEVVLIAGDTNSQNFITLYLSDIMSIEKDDCTGGWSEYTIDFVNGIVLTVDIKKDVTPPDT